MLKMSNSISWILKTCVIVGLIVLLWNNLEKINSSVLSNFPAPLALLFLITCLCAFAAYSASIVFYRVFTFNNCEVASLELKKQIEDAKADLMSKGIKFKEK